jgi:hypothetical protein
VGTEQTRTGQRTGPVRGPVASEASGRRDHTPPGGLGLGGSLSGAPREASAGRTSDAGEYLTAAAIVALGGLFWIGAADYSEAARRWPTFLSSVVVVLGVVNLVALLYRRRIARAPAAEGGSAADQDADVAQPSELRAGQRRQVATGLFCIGYAVLGYGAGFLVATAVLLPLYILLAFRRRRPLLAALVTVALLVFMHLVFGGALNAPLHRGVWVGLDLSWLPF